MRDNPSDEALEEAFKTLLATRPTAVNLRWALEDMQGRLKPLAPGQRADAAYARAQEICDEDVMINHAIGTNGLEVFKKIWRQKQQATPGAHRLNILTHCNAGWLATVDWGTALAPIYMAHDEKLPVHVWVDETRPRNQGAAITAWELGRHGVPHTLIVDNAGGHLMQQGEVDICIVGTDRTTATGDVCNKIGTYLKALAAHDNGVPFYVALPASTIDWTVRDGLKEIPIEQRDATEVTTINGAGEDGQPLEVMICPEGTSAANYAFDVTPSRLVTGLITERGVCPATEECLLELFPEHAPDKEPAAS